MKVTFHIINGQPKVRPPKPLPNMNTDNEDDYWKAADSYKQDIKEWKEGLNVVNVQEFESANEKKWFIVNKRKKSNTAGYISNFKKKYDIIPISENQSYDYNLETKTITNKTAI